MKPAEFWTHVDQGLDCWPWLGSTNSNGRGRIYFAGRMQYAYRVAWELTHGEPIPNDREACHSCDNPICVRPSHIFIGTRSDNARDAAAKGRLHWNGRQGVEHHTVTVSPELVARAVEEYLTGPETQAEVGARYGVTQSAVSQWVRGKVRPDSRSAA